MKFLGHVLIKSKETYKCPICGKILSCFGFATEFKIFACSRLECNHVRKILKPRSKYRKNLRKVCK